MKNLRTFDQFLNENYWEVNHDTTKIFPVKNDKEAEALLSGKQVAVYDVEKPIKALDVYGKERTIRRGTSLDVYVLINSGDIHSHSIYVDRKNKLYFPSNYRGNEQRQRFEDNTIMRG